MLMKLEMFKTKINSDHPAIIAQGRYYGTFYLIYMLSFEAVALLKDYLAPKLMSDLECIVALSCIKTELASWGLCP